MSDSPAPDERVDEHVVFFTTALGDPAAERYPSLQSAVSRVESLCNEDHVQDAKVYALVPVPLQVRSYFRVEVDSSVGQAAPAAPAAPDVPPRSAVLDAGFDPLSDPQPAAAAHHDLVAGPAPTPWVAPDDPSPTPWVAPDDPALDMPEPADGASSRGRNLGFFVH